MARLKMPNNRDSPSSKNSESGRSDCLEVEISENHASRSAVSPNDMDLDKGMISKAVSLEEFQQLFGSSDEVSSLVDLTGAYRNASMHLGIRISFPFQNIFFGIFSSSCDIRCYLCRSRPGKSEWRLFSDITIQ